MWFIFTYIFCKSTKGIINFCQDLQKKKNTTLNRFRNNEESKIMEKRLLTNYSGKTGHFRRQPNRGPDLVPRD